MSLLVAVLLVGGCRPAPLSFPASLNSPRPEERARAAKQAASHSYSSPEDRQTAMHLLVARLDDDDDAVRFFSILALEHLTGTRMGYSYHASEDQRSRAVRAWRRYLDQHGLDATLPAPPAAGAQPVAASVDGEATESFAPPGGAGGRP